MNKNGIDIMETNRADLVRKYMNRIEPFPERPPLNLTVLSKRKRLCYEEWKVEYTCWCAEEMPEPALRKIPAYILVPTDEQYVAPYPAMICFHQCNGDCWMGKDAVVGNQVDRPDQAYGFELVHQGFVVIAPDHMLCGERWVAGAREDGERQMDCVAKVISLTKTPWGDEFHRMGTFEMTRSVDVLESLDFVDSSRIGAIGHSMGAAEVPAVMAADERVRCGIVSGGMPSEEMLACIAPRLLIQVRGRYDYGGGVLDRVKETNKVGQSFYAELGRPDNLILRLGDCQHHFHAALKRFAYKRIKVEFAMLPEKQHLSLSEIIRNACQENCEFVESPRDVKILGDRNLEGAVGGIVGHLKEKVPYGYSLAVEIKAGQAFPCVVLTISQGDDSVKAAHDDLSQNEQVLYENDIEFKRIQLEHELRYELVFRSAT